MYVKVGRGRVGAVVVSGIASVLLAAPTVLAESGFSDPVTLRTGPAGTSVSLHDLAASGDRVSVVWGEVTRSTSVVRLRTSTNGGRTFRSQRLVEDRQGSSASTDVCGGRAWVAHSFRRAGHPEGTDGLIVRGFEASGPGRSAELVVRSGGAQHVGATGFACVGSRRRAVAWVDRDFESASTVHVRFLATEPDVEGEGPPDFDASFRADGFTSVAVAATRTHAWLAWETADDRIRVKRFDIGPGPSFTATPRAAVTLRDAGSVGSVVLGASGRKVVLGYRAGNATYARVSVNKGTTFGARRVLVDYSDFADIFTGVVSADIRGRRAVVYEATAGVSDDVSITAHRFVSDDDGRSWRRVTRNSDGDRLGAFVVSDGGTRLVEAWDNWASDAARKRIRFHREL